MVELAYLLCYPLVPLSFAVVWLKGSPGDIERFWLTVLVAGYGCYATLPWLVSRPPRNQRESIDYRMAEFFVKLKERRLGVGRDAARLIFNRFAGTWEVSEFLYNAPAVKFWRSIVAEYTGGKYRETTANGEVSQVFQSVSARR